MYEKIYQDCLSLITAFILFILLYRLYIYQTCLWIRTQFNTKQTKLKSLNPFASYGTTDRHTEGVKKEKGSTSCMLDSNIKSVDLRIEINPIAHETIT